MPRNTIQKTIIRNVFQREARPLTAGEVLQAAKKERRGIGLATIYRSINMLLSEGQIVKVEISGDMPRYEISGHHHHHFKCLNCKGIFEIHECPGELAKMLPTGFVLKTHEISLFGSCSDCAQPSRIR